MNPEHNRKTLSVRRRIHIEHMPFMGRLSIRNVAFDILSLSSGKERDGDDEWGEMFHGILSGRGRRYQEHGVFRWRYAHTLPGIHRINEPVAGRSLRHSLATSVVPNRHFRDAAARLAAMGEDDAGFR